MEPVVLTIFILSGKSIIRQSLEATKNRHYLDKRSHFRISYEKKVLHGFLTNTRSNRVCPM